MLRRLAARPEAPWLHAEVARRMAERLPVIKLRPQSVIEWWGALGASGQALDAAYPEARRWIVEPDAQWQSHSRAQRARPWWSPKRWTGAAPEVVTPAELPAHAGQLLWANMMLQGAADPPGLMAQWHQALGVDGFLMFSTLGPGTLPELRELYAEFGWGSPMAPLVDMHDLGDMLVHAGFADPVMDQETLTLTWTSPDALLAELRGLGGNADPRRVPGLRTLRWKQRLADALTARADAQGRIAMRFEIVYGHAFRPAPRPRVQSQTSVSLDSMREMVRSGRQP